MNFKVDAGEIEQQASRLVAGDRRALARAITLVESTRPEDQARAERLLGAILPATGKSIRLGITGTPGVGKSTFIEAFGTSLTAKGHKVAVLAVDPSSARTGGSILGDKTRMEQLARDENAFIRPSPSGATLGGVARRTREAMLCVEAAGFDVVLVETVGVGQSETTVAEMVDMFLLLLAPGGGDDLQGIKRGIMELADLIIINKADGDLLKPANIARSDYQHAIHMIRPRSPNWFPEVLLASALTGSGLTEVWAAVTKFRDALGRSGEITSRRAEQSRGWMWRELGDALIDKIKSNQLVASKLPELEADVAAGRKTPAAAVSELLKSFGL